MILKTHRLGTYDLAITQVIVIGSLLYLACICIQLVTIIVHNIKTIH